MPDFWLSSALLVAFVSGAVAGWCSAAIKFWSLRRWVTELSYRIEDQEARIVRETKQRASLEGVRARGKRLEDELRDIPVTVPDRKLPSIGSPTWLDWYHGKMKG